MKSCLFCKKNLSQREKEKRYQFNKRMFCNKHCAKKFNMGTLKDRIERHSLPEPNSGCWLWTGSVSDWGYGNIRVGGKTRIASRVSWEASFGPIPRGMKVLHRCDTPACVNPDHLFLGTDKDNNYDKIKKGRHVQLRGEELPQSKLTNRDVLEIRKSTDGAVPIAEKYGVSRGSIRRIIRRESWKHI